MDSQNITLRRHKTTINESLNLSFTSTTSDYLAKSLPDLSSGCLDQDNYNLLKKEIDELKLKLSSADNEIDNLTMEINELKKITISQEKTIL